MSNLDAYRDETQIAALTIGVAVTTFTIANIIFSKMPPAEADVYRQSILSQLDERLTEMQHGSIGQYAEVLSDPTRNGGLTNAHLLPAPEDLQAEYVKVSRSVRASMERALWPDGRTK